MKFIKRLVLLLAALLIITVAVAGFYLQNSKPDYNESAILIGLDSKVDVYYDEYAIPHIYAGNETDAYRAFGYVHAKERLWQMELIRRVAPGRLSEVFGDATVKTDKFFRMIGISEYSKTSVRLFNENAEPMIKDKVMAYLEGINQFIDQGQTPLEFTILGLEKSHFTLEDVYNTLGYMSFSFAMAHKTEPILTHILEKHGAGYLKDLMIEVDSNSTIIESASKATELEELSIQVDKIMNGLPVPAFLGSNSWVVSGNKTKNGKVLFANDPHIAFSQPSVWYEAHINTPDLNLYGYWLAGFPFPQLIHTDHHAIGLTMFENDDIDFFREKPNPVNADQYEYKGEWLSFGKREEVIKVKDAEDVKMTIKTTVHGPVINDGVKGLGGSDPVSMWWVYTLHDNKNLEASYKLGKAKNMAEAREGAAMIHDPGLNIMYGDKDGNVAWWAAAKLPIRPDHVNPKLILDGSTGYDDPIGYFDFSENPQAENPEWGYVYSANNQSRSPSGKLHPGYYLPEDRAKRIVHLLEEKNDWTADDFKKMLTDVTSENASSIAKNMAGIVDLAVLNDLEKDALEKLAEWDGSCGLNSTAPVIYNKMLYHVSYTTFADELGGELFDVFNGSHLMKRSIQPLFANESSKWWDDVSTPELTETRTSIMTAAFKKSIDELSTQLGTDLQKWHWDQVHTLEHGHSFAAVPSLKKYFNIGPFPVPGNNETINNMIFRLQPDGTYEVLAGPSTRRIVDFADVAGNSWSILPTGQSGNVMSDHYSDQAEMYAKGEFRRQLMDKEEVVKTAKSHTEFLVK